MNNFLPAIKKVIAAYNQTSLILRILIGLIIGALIGLFIPSMKWMAEFGTLFVGALRSIAPILVFVIVSSALCQNSARLDKRFGRVIFLYMLTTFGAAVLAVITSKMFPQTLVLGESASAEVITLFPFLLGQRSTWMERRLQSPL